MDNSRHWLHRGATAAFAIVAVLEACAPSHRPSSGNVSSALPPCNRQCVRQELDAFVAAVSERDPKRVRLAPGARVTENGRDSRLGDGLWQTAGALGTYRIYIIDPDSGGGAVQTVMRDREELVQIQVRLKVGAAGITQVEILVAREGDTCCWAPQRLDSLGSTYDEPVREGSRMNREELVAAAEAYFAALHHASTPEYRRPPIAVDMNRYENGRQTTNVSNGNRVTREGARAQLDRGLFGRISVVNRRYPVVDVESGTVLGIVVFEYPGSTRPSEIISEFFKISGGSIQEIRAVMVKQPTTGWR